MPVSAHILIISNSGEKRIADCLEQTGYAHTVCPFSAFDDKAMSTGAYDLVLLVTSHIDTNAEKEILNRFSDLSVPILVVGPNPAPTSLQSVSEDFSELELTKRIISLVRLQTMEREFARRSETTGLYGFKPEEVKTDELAVNKTEVMIVGGKSDTLGAVLLQLDNKTKIHVCQNSESAIDELRAGQFDALIIIGAGQGDIHFRLCNDIRADSRLFNLPVVFVLEHEHNREAAYIHGASDVVLLPAEMENLYARTALHVQQADYRFSLQKLFKASKPFPVTDGPTGLYSYGFMKAHMGKLIDDHQDEDKLLSVATLTITNLEEINREYGFPAGDQILRQVGTIISFLVRGEDFCCRYGGGQFLIALPCTSKKDAKIALNRVYGVTRNTDFSVIGHEEPVSANVIMGLAELSSGDSIEQVIERGHNAMDDSD